MDEHAPVSTKKCPFCQQWSEWKQQPDDRCTHCGQLLDPQASESQRQAATTARQPAATAVRLIEIRPGDSGWLRALKWVGRGGQLLFIGVVSFFIWLVTVLVA